MTAKPFGHLILAGSKKTTISFILSESSSIFEGNGIVVSPSGDYSAIKSIRVQTPKKIINELGTVFSKTALPLKNYKFSHSGLSMRVTVKKSVGRKKTWQGSVRNEKNGETFSFFLEEFGSPGWFVVIAVVIAIACAARVIADALNSCCDKAIKACGAGNVAECKSDVSVLRGCKFTCSFKCQKKE